MTDKVIALVMRSTGSWYELRDPEGEIFKARIRGRLRLSGSRSTNPVVVGDRVECTVDEGGEVWIEAVMPRRNYIIRRSSNLSRESHIIASNLDGAIVVATLFSPATPTEFIDRFLVTCEAYRIPAVIVLNKIDLLRAEGLGEAMEHFIETYRRAGYPVLPVSALTGEGIDALRELLAGRTTLVSGNSGVGKSTLIKAVSPALDIRIGEISRAHSKGMHTTTFSQMYTLFREKHPAGTLPQLPTEAVPDVLSPAESFRSAHQQGTFDEKEAGAQVLGVRVEAESYIIDTPGIKGFGLVDISGGELYHYFPEMMRVAPACQFYNCIHVHEPGCAVRRAVEEGEISEERYISYLKMLEEDGKYR
jgi:ribosome biogenesis GTPase